MGIPEWIQGMLREGRYASFSDMSYNLRIPETPIRRWADGSRLPSVSYCIKIARATSTSIEEIVQMVSDGTPTAAK